MVLRNFLNDSSVSVVADASVVINLNATGCMDSILEALPNRLLITEEVAEEVGFSCVGANAVSTLKLHGYAEIVALSPTEMQRFSSLVAGSASQTLGDGEAATITCALEYGAIALIDDRKARRICSERFPQLMTGFTVDVFTHHRVAANLGRKQLSDAVFNALCRGRMRIPYHHLEWVVDLIGRHRATKCLSLPQRIRQAGEPPPAC